jgi:endonuclease YncB( thermonuclease family)
MTTSLPRATINSYTRARDVEAASINTPNVSRGLLKPYVLMALLVGIVAGAMIAFVGKKAFAADAISGIAAVSDGDTVVINGTRIRLHGIDAPEAAQTCMGPRGGSWNCGYDAAKMMSDLTAGKTVTCTPKGNDKYARTLASCAVDGVDLGAAMVCRGMAWSFTEYSRDYDKQEDDAKGRKVGIWRADTVPAWTYRKVAWDKAVTEAPLGKPIVGNWKSKTDCTYHTPWSRYYRTLKLTTPNKRFYADEAEAVAAGCVPPKFMPSFGDRLRQRKSRVPAAATVSASGSPCP